MSIRKKQSLFSDLFIISRSKTPKSYEKVSPQDVCFSAGVEQGIETFDDSNNYCGYLQLLDK